MAAQPARMALFVPVDDEPVPALSAGARLVRFEPVEEEPAAELLDGVESSAWAEAGGAPGAARVQLVDLPGSMFHGQAAPLPDGPATPQEEAAAQDAMRLREPRLQAWDGARGLPAPEASFSRVVRAAGQELAAWPSHAAASLRSNLEGVERSDAARPLLIPKSLDAEQRGELAKRTAVLEGQGVSASLALEALAPAYLRELGREDEASRYAEAYRLNRETRERRLAAMDAAKGVEEDASFQLSPDFEGRSSGLVEDAARGLAGSAPDILAMAVNPPLGAASMYAHLQGAKVKEIEEDLQARGVAEPEAKRRALMASSASAAAQLPLEYLGNFIQLKSVVSRGTWVKHLVDIAEAHLGEGITEYAQQYPDEFASYWAANADKPAGEIAAGFGRELPAIHRRAQYAGLVGGVAGAGMAGLGKAGVAVARGIESDIARTARRGGDRPLDVDLGAGQPDGGDREYPMSALREVMAPGYAERAAANGDMPGQVLRFEPVEENFSASRQDGGPVLTRFEPVDETAGTVDGAAKAAAGQERTVLFEPVEEAGGGDPDPALAAFGSDPVKALDVLPDGVLRRVSAALGVRRGPKRAAWIEKILDAGSPEAVREAYQAELARPASPEGGLRETRVPVPAETFSLVGAEPGGVWADYAALQAKHPEYFDTPEEVRAHVEYVVAAPQYSLPATKKEYTLLVRRNGADKAVVVEFLLRGGKYRVRSAYVMDTGQLERKLKKAGPGGSSVPPFPAESGGGRMPSGSPTAPFEAVRQGSAEEIRPEGDFDKARIPGLQDKARGGLADPAKEDGDGRSGQPGLGEHGRGGSGGSAAAGQATGVRGGGVAVQHVGGEVQARYELVELDDIAASHLPRSSFQKNPAYGLTNERAYHSDKGEQEKVIGRSLPGRFKPAFLLSESVDATHGAPIVDAQGNVLGGNSRAMLLDLAYDDAASRAAYISELRSRAANFGIEAADVDGMRRPVLIRRVEGDLSAKEKAALVHRFNQDFKQDLDSRGEGVSKSRFVSDRSFSILAEGLSEHGSLRAYLDSKVSTRLVDSLLEDGAMEETRKSRYVTPSGLLNTEGKAYVEQVLRGMVAKDYELVRNLPASLTNLLDRILPHAARVMARGGEWDITPQLREALRLYTSYLSGNHETLAAFLDQGELVNPDPAKQSKVVRLLLHAMDRMKPTQFERAWSAYANKAMMTQGGKTVLPGMETSPAEALGAFGREQEARPAARRAPGGLASDGGYADIPREDGAGGATAAPQAGPEADEGDLPAVMQMPELVRLARELMQGRLPKVMKRLRKDGAVGLFRPRGGGEILELAEHFKDTTAAERTLAHEIGHLVDYLPDRQMKRGNILGRIASLKKYLKHWLEEKPGGMPPLSRSEKDRLRRIARKLLTEDAEVWVDEVIRTELPITPEDVLSIWNALDPAVSADLYNYVAGLSSAEKKSIIREALRGVVREDLQKFSKVIEERTGRKILEKRSVEPDADAVRTKWRELVEEEIRKRALLSAETIREELQAFTRLWRPFRPEADAKYTAYRYSSAELYADALSGLLTHPRLLRRTAPEFWRGFFGWLGVKPDVKRVWEEIQADIKSGRVQERRVRDLREGFRKGDEAYGKKYDTSLRLPERVKAALFDEFSPVYDAVSGDRPKRLVERALYTGSMKELYVRRVAHEVLDRLKAAGLNAEDFGEYLFHRRVVNERAELANPLGFTREASQQRLSEMGRTWGPEKMAALREARDSYRAIREREVIARLRESGMFSQDLMRRIEDAEDYVTFDVVKYIDERHGKGVGAAIVKQWGTFEEISNPFSATVMKDLSLVAAAEWNRAKAATAADLLRQGKATDAPLEWNGRGRSPVAPTQEGLGLLTWMDNGDVRGVHVDELVAEAFSRENAWEVGALGRILAATAAPFRVLFTLIRPGFQLFNVLRDGRRTMRNLPGGHLGFLRDYARAIGPAFESTFGTPPDLVQRMEREGMLISIADFQGLSREETQMDRLAVMYRLAPAKYENRVLKPLAKLWTMAMNVNGALERIPKIAAYEFVQREFPHMDKEELAHIIRAEAGSPAFLRKGRLHPLYNNIFLFSNAMKEGWRGDAEAMRRDPAGWWWRYAKYTLLPGIMVSAAAAGWFGPAIMAIMAGVGDYEKENYDIIPLGLTRGGKSVYLRIPRDETARMMGAVAWRMLHWNQKGAEGFWDYMAGQAPNVSPAFSNVSAILDYMAGQNPYDSFYHRNAVEETAFQAGGWPSRVEFGKWLWNRSGGTLLYQFRSEDVEPAKTELEEVLALPGMADTVGRFLKVSDRGLREELREAKEEVRTARAQKLLRLRAALGAMMSGGTVTEEQAALLADEPEWLQRNLLNFAGKRNGDALTRELLNANSNAEKAAVLNRWDALQRRLGRGEETR